MTNKYTPEGPTPNWPIELNSNHFSHYCSPVIEAVTSGLNRVLSTTEADPVRVLNPLELEALKNKWNQNRDAITPEELGQLQQAYSLEVDIIHLLSDL
jgi:hypothetical protein